MSNNMPLVSIIIPVFNREGLILETLKSILEQSYQNWECIIVDDHSTDGTYTVISDYIKEGKKISLVKRPENKIKGACSCRNHGYKLSNGDYINWFDSDDIMHQDFLLLKVQKLLSSETIDGVVSKTAFFKDDYRELFDKEKRTILTGTLLEDFIALKVSWYLPDVLWKKTFLIGKDLFDEELLMGQDRIFHIKMLAGGPNLVLLDEYLTFYRKHQNSISATYFSEKYIDKTISHLRASMSLIVFLKKKELLSSAVKTAMYKAGIMYLPYTYNNSINKELIKYLAKLFVFNAPTIKNGVKFYFALLVYKIIGKGYAILKL